MYFISLRLILILLTVLRGSIGDIVQFPLNAAVVVGSTAVFNCTSNQLVTGWYLSKDGTANADNLQTITNYCDVQPGYSDHYRTEPSGGYQPRCNLIVFNATMLQAGVYTCADGITENQKAYTLLTVLASLPTITANQSDVLVGETLRVSCSIGYNGSVSPAPLLPPSIYWTSSKGVNISSNPSPSQPSNSVESYILVTPDRSSESVGPFICNGFFEQPQNLPNSSLNFATNAPTIVYGESSSVYDMLYVPENVSVTVEPDACLYKPAGLVLRCSASANPSPTYSWVDLAKGYIISQNSTVSVYSEGVYRCIAANDIRSIRYCNSADIAVIECEVTTSDKTAVVVLGVLFSISILVIVGLVTWWVVLPKIRGQEGLIQTVNDETEKQAQRQTDSTDLPPNVQAESSPSNVNDEFPQEQYETEYDEPYLMPYEHFEHTSTSNAQQEGPNEQPMQGENSHELEIQPKAMYERLEQPNVPYENTIQLKPPYEQLTRDETPHEEPLHTSEL